MDRPKDDVLFGDTWAKSNPFAVQRYCAVSRRVVPIAVLRLTAR